MSKKPLNLPPAAGVAAGVVIGAVAVGAAALAVGSSCLQLVHTRAGIARVKGIRGEHGEKIRVLQQGGVYQSATYVGERRFEPVFAYYRAFDAMFEAEPVLCAASGHGVERVLMLGGGGYAYPKHALTQHAGLVMDVAWHGAGFSSTSSSGWQASACGASRRMLAATSRAPWQRDFATTLSSTIAFRAPSPCAVWRRSRRCAKRRSA